MSTDEAIDPSGSDVESEQAGPERDPNATDQPGTSSGTGGRAGLGYEVRNCTNDHVEVRAGDRRFRLSPLGASEIDDAAIVTFAIHKLAERHILRLSAHQATKSGIEGGAVVGIGFWVLVGYFAILGAINSDAGKLAFGLGGPIAVVVVGLVVLAALKKRLTDVAQGLSLVFVVALGAGLPIGTFVVFGDFSFLAANGGSAEFFGRLAQTSWIVIASLVPTMLYFIFDRQRALTIRRNFQRDIMRLDPSVATLYDIDAKYGDQLIETIGAEVGPRARVSRANPYPIFIAAALTAIGWLLVLPVRDEGPGALDAGGLASYFTPERQVYVFGFLGTYFFSINLIARRYVRGDLRPKTYGTISVRILTVFVLAWVLEVVFTAEDWVYVAAFLIGILPETFFTLISEGRRAILGTISDAMREPHPLTRLEGIDLYDRSRLQDEGVNNVEALAHHDLVELMLATRIPVPRLVDWVDQAILYLHTVDEHGKPIGRDHLRACGVRTASDLVAMSTDADLWRMLLDGDQAGPRSRLALVNAAISDDEWISHILAWRRPTDPGELTFDIVEGNLSRR